MRLLRRTLSVLFISSALAAVAAETQEPAALVFAPADTNIVATVNIKQVIASQPFKAKLSTVPKNKVEAVTGFVKNMTGVDPFKDIDSAWLWGKADKPESFVVMIRGEFKQEQMINLLKTFDDYGTTEAKGMTVHTWFDKKEHHEKFGAFLPDGSAAIFNSLSQVEGALEAKEQGNGFLSTPGAKLIPADWAQTTAWAIQVKPEKSPRFKETLRAQSAILQVNLNDKGAQAEIAINTDGPDSAQKWADMAKGFLAVARLQQSEANLTKLADAITVDVKPDSPTMKIDLAVSNEDLATIGANKKHQ